MQAVDIEFKGDGSRFSALWDAQNWCTEHGVSYGPTSRWLFVGLMIGEYNIAKWHNLSQEEVRTLHGHLKIGDPCASVVLTIKPEHETLLRPIAAFTAAWRTFEPLDIQAPSYPQAKDTFDDCLLAMVTALGEDQARRVYDRVAGGEPSSAEKFGELLAMVREWRGKSV